jgi:hypothetical protein
MIAATIIDEVVRFEGVKYFFAARCGICGSLLQRLVNKPVRFPVDIDNCTGCGAANKMNGAA